MTFREYLVKSVTRLHGTERAMWHRAFTAMFIGPDTAHMLETDARDMSATIADIKTLDDICI